MADEREAILGPDGPAAPPRENGELVFRAPWESRVFGLTMALRERGLLDWNRFRECLIAEIAAWEQRAAAGEWSYYACWQAALERLLADDGLCTGAELDSRHRDYAARPHGHDH